MATVGSTVLLDSTGSSDPEGAPLKFAWIQSRGPLVQLSNPTVARPTFIPPVSGYYEFQLTVNDGVQSSLPAKVTFNVIPNSSSTVPTGTIAVAPTTTIVPGGSSFTPSFTVAPTLWQWTQTAGPRVDLTNPNNSWSSQVPTQVVGFSPTSRPGVYRSEMWAWDGNQVLTILPVSVTVNTSGSNLVPTAKAAASPGTVQVGETVTLDGSGSTDDSLPLPAPPGARYMWSQISGPTVGLSDATAVKPTFVVPAAGVYVFTLKVNDGTSDSSPDFVVVTAKASDVAATGGGNGGGGCGLGAELMLILPGLWVAAWFRRRSVK